MSKSLESDLILFAAAFIAAALVLGADTSLAEIMEMIDVASAAVTNVV